MLTSSCVDGRFFEIIQSPNPSQECSAIISHFQEGNVNGETGIVSIPHGSINHQGNKCSTGEMLMESSPENNPVAGIGRSDEIFENFQASDGFWVGKSTRSCGRWDLPNPTAVFMLFDKDTDIAGPYEVTLPRGNRYMIFTNSQFTCIYRDVPKPSPKPSLAGSSGGDNETFSSDESFNDGNDIGVPVTVLPGAPDDEPEASAEEDDGSTCFPADATVELENGSTKTMAALSIGDRVRVGSNEFSDVFMFTHRLAAGQNDFIRISTSSTVITLTKGHYLYVNGALSAAKTVKKGDSLQLASGEVALVEAISAVKGTGLYNPQTVNGDIIVNNVRASTYTTAVEPMLAHNLLTPFRALYNGLGVATALFDAGADEMAKMIPSGAAVY